MLQGIRPDQLTFVNLVVGLCNAHLPFEALSYWDEMKRCASIAKHFT